MPVNVCDVFGEIGPITGSQSLVIFTRNHDFVEIDTDTKRIYIDACAYDYLYDDLRGVEIKK